RALYLSCRASALRVLSAGGTQLDYPAVGLLLSALGTWGLLRQTVPAQDAVRLLALADRFCYIRTTPTMMRERIVPAAEESAPGLLAELHAEYADRQPPDLLAEVRRLAERLPS
ncbi:MAG: transcriptional regulator, partial [Trebonia sp.]